MASKPTTARRPAAPSYGPNGTATRATLEELGVDPGLSVLGSLAVTVADFLDSGQARSQLPNCARELRAILAELEGRTSLDEGELDAFLRDLTA